MTAVCRILPAAAFAVVLLLVPPAPVVDAAFSSSAIAPRASSLVASSTHRRMAGRGDAFASRGASSAFSSTGAFGPATPFPTASVRTYAAAAARKERGAIRRTPSALKMGYNLPPSGGGGNRGPFDELKSIATPVLTAGALLLFFLSPLGSIFFAVTNTLFLLALLAPLVIWAGFQGWKLFYTFEAPCPNCGSTVTVLKEDAQPSICLSCGSLVRPVSEGATELELCNNPNDIMRGGVGGGSIFDDLFGGTAGGGQSERAGLDDFFGGQGPREGDYKKQREDKQRREGTIIDVEVTKDE